MLSLLLGVAGLVLVLVLLSVVLRRRRRHRPHLPIDPPAVDALRHRRLSWHGAPVLPDEPDEEMTNVAARPAAHMLAGPSSSGLRLAPASAAIPPPASGRGGAS
jgi:hypothetical protein